MQSVDELAMSIHEVESLLSDAASKLGQVITQGVAVERELGLSPMVTSSAHGHATTSLTSVNEAMRAFTRMHRLVQAIAKAKDVTIRADGGGDKNAPESVWEFPLMGASGSLDAIVAAENAAGDAPVFDEHVALLGASPVYGDGDLRH